MTRRLATALVLLIGCGSAKAPVVEDTYQWQLPQGFPAPFVPADNPMSEAKVQLGRRLFYDVRLSGNQSMSCASCHLQSLAFTDGKALAVGSTGQVHPRNSMSLANIAYASTLTWANPLQIELEQQALVPILGTSPVVELGVEGLEQEVLQRFRADPTYREAFAAAFTPDEPVSFGLVTKALASFQRTLLSGNSAYDRYRYQGDTSALSAAQKRGEALFFSETMECFHCHEGFNLSSATRTAQSKSRALSFFNTGLYNVDGAGAYPANNQGVLEVSGDLRDMGRFKPPTLRNIAVTAPYMHDGSIPTLRGVIVDHYGRGGRLISGGADSGDGSKSPLKNSLVRGFTLTDEELDDVIAFLGSLTDETFLSDPKFGPPL